MKLVGRWTLLFTLSFFALTQSLGFRGLTKSLVLEGKVRFLLRVSSFCKKPFFCQTMDLNFSLACQSRYELKIWIFFFLVFPAAAASIQTQIYRVSWHFPLATPWFFFCPTSDDELLKLEEIEADYEDCVLWFRVLAIFSTKLHLFPLLFAPSVEPIRAVRETPPQSEQSYFKKGTPPNLAWPI